MVLGQALHRLLEQFEPVLAVRLRDRARTAIGERQVGLDTVLAPRIARGDAELVARRETRLAIREGEHRRLARQRDVGRPLGLAHRDLKQATDHHARVVLVLQPMVHLGVLANDLALVARLLQRAHVEGRADDTEDVIRRRLEVYFDQTAPLIDAYEGQGLLVKVDGMGAVDEVTARVLAALGL